MQRGRLLIGAEIGHYWIFDGKIFDLSGYGKFVDNVVQNFSDITVSQGVQSITFQGIGESRYGADAGASASLSLTNTARLYVNYDAKYAPRCSRIRARGAGVEVVVHYAPRGALRARRHRCAMLLTDEGLMTSSHGSSAIRPHPAGAEGERLKDEVTPA